MQRRQLLAVLASGGLAVAAYRLFGGGGMSARGLTWPRGVTPALTPAGAHYQVSKNALFPDPRVDVAGWRLDVYGLVRQPVSLTLDDLRALPAVEQPATLACISNGVPARAISTAVWTGARLADVLARAGGPDPSAADLVFVSADNYTDSIPVAKALDAGTILAYEMNGAPIPRGHGAPLRAIVPGIYGMKNAKWIEAIELVGGDYLGYWQQRGWSDRAPYVTLSRIDEPRAGDRVAAGQPLAMGGMAFAGDRGIARVDLAVDGAWQPTALDPPLGPDTWRIWRATWTPPRAGRYTLAVRATDGTGATQPETRRPSFPDGATGWHTIVIDAG
ncbi:MAG: molybdopterin-dependent oxidoreductase [Acidobacteriota bacterium]